MTETFSNTLEAPSAAASINMAVSPFATLSELPRRDEQASAQPTLRQTDPSPMASSLMQIPVTLQVVLGTARMPLSRIADLKSGSIVNLDQKLGTPATILVNGREMARGTLFVLDGDDARLGITITEVIATGAAGGAP